MSNTLTDADQKELSAFLESEQSKARVQTTVHAFTERCWDQCMTSSIGARFGRGEEACLSNCVERFLDTSLFIVGTLL
ncbi:Mitochondrial import inner membrane translocase subunit tim8 [Malassezia nana]|uniref:Mitochondrial import inner membrane translocase subunit n=1 Tax=Malassezia nana TaxID=180528 RepID=A0AAF0J2T3_9BASI|nr:Mitochondrial import inner membrane translocase subunit tim8 [Malassezia nana]